MSTPDGSEERWQKASVQGVKKWTERATWEQWLGKWFEDRGSKRPVNR